MTEEYGRITLKRLDEQISWYARKSRIACFLYKSLKILQIMISAIIPLISLFINEEAERIMAVLGVIILFIEGLQQLNQYQQTWLIYRSTCEMLKHEKYTYLAGAGVYTTADNAEIMLSERTEALMLQEHSRWYSLQEKTHSSAQTNGK